jgi:hypothetical protein
VELEESNVEFKPVHDQRPTMPQPLPVWLVAVNDLAVSAPAGIEIEMDQFYVDLLKFEREPTAADPPQIIYRADNFRLHLSIVEPPLHRVDPRPIGIDVPSLSLLERALIDRELEYQKLRGTVPGQLWLLLQDPAGNWVQLGEVRPV